MITLQVPASITDADDIVNIISKWVQSNPSVTVNEVILDIDPECPAMLDSVSSDDCVIKTPPPNQTSPSTLPPPQSSSSSSSSLPINIIAGGAIGMVIIVIIIITIVGIIIYCRRKSSYRYYKLQYSLSRTYAVKDKKQEIIFSDIN